MKSIAIIGLGSFGIRMLEELHHFMCDVILIDSDEDRLALYSDMAASTHLLNGFTKLELRKCIPPYIETVIVDSEQKIDVSVMITSFLKEMGMKEIVVKASSDPHADVLMSVGATRVIFPDREAAKQVVPQLTCLNLFNFMPVSDSFVLAEVAVPEALAGKTLAESNVRRDWGISVVAMRLDGGEAFSIANNPNYALKSEDVLLIAGTEEAVLNFSHINDNSHNDSMRGFFSKLFPNKKK